MNGFTKLNLSFDNMAEKSVFIVNIGDEIKKFVTYKNSDYSNIYCQTYTKNAQAMGKYLDKMINQSKRYGAVNKVIILRYKTLQRLASFDHVSNTLYICEELIDKQLFLKKVDETYFPSRTVEDVLNHELGGHKKHWEAIYAYQKKNGVSEAVAKQQLEEKIRKYVANQVNSDILYIKRYVSNNAQDMFKRKNLLNELIVDVYVLYKQEKMTDKYLFDLVMEVLFYDND